MFNDNKARTVLGFTVTPLKIEKCSVTSRENSTGE